MRRSVDLPAPFAPTTASVSPLFTVKEIPRKAGTVRREAGYTNARHPEVPAGKYFSTLSRLSARLSTKGRYNLSNDVKQGPTIRRFHANAWEAFGWPSLESID